MPEADIMVIKYLVATLGINALVFVIWYIYHKSQTRAWDAQRETQEKAFMRLIEDHKDRDDKNFTVLNRYAEVLEYQAGCLARMETSINNNQFCPVIRKEGGKG